MSRGGDERGDAEGILRVAALPAQTLSSSNRGVWGGGDESRELGMRVGGKWYSPHNRSVRGGRGGVYRVHVQVHPQRRWRRAPGAARAAQGGGGGGDPAGVPDSRLEAAGPCVCERVRARACLSRHPRQSGGGCRAKEKGGGGKRCKTYTRRRSRYDGRLCLAEEEAVERRKIDQTILPPRRDIDQARGEGLPESHSHMAATASLDDDGLRAAELSTLSSIP